MKTKTNFFNTTYSEVAKEYREEAKIHLLKLKDLSDEIITVIDMIDSSNNQKTEVVPYSWIKMLNDKVLEINNEVFRANGALLVRGKNCEHCGKD